jgi:RNA polymerase sigma-70 factor (ECF subfamily)
MQGTANARCRKVEFPSLARPIVEKRHSPNSDVRPSLDCISKKAAPPSSQGFSNKRNEPEAIQQAQDGDRVAFEYLYQLHRRRVYALCLRMVRNPTEAEDLTQDVFLLVLRKIHTFRGKSAFSTWLHRLTFNLVLMHLRKMAPPMVSIEGTNDLLDGSGSSSMEIGASDLLLEGSIDRMNLERCIERLPVSSRTVLVLYDIEGYRHNEIAKILGRSVGGSKSQLHKARTRLREMLHEVQREKTRDERMIALKMRSRSGATLLLRNSDKSEELTLI